MPVKSTSVLGGGRDSPNIAGYAAFLVTCYLINIIVVRMPRTVIPTHGCTCSPRLDTRDRRYTAVGNVPGGLHALDDFAFTRFLQ